MEATPLDIFPVKTCSNFHMDPNFWIICAPNSLLLGFSLRNKLATLTGCDSVSGLCGQALWLGSVARSCPPLVLLLSFSCPAVVLWRC